MAFVEVDDSMEWRAEPDSLECAQVVQLLATDTPYVSVDFSAVLDNAGDLIISSASTPSEKDSKTISLTDVSVSDDGKQVSFKVASNDGAGDYSLDVPVTLSKGTTNLISRRCVLRVV